VTEHATTRVVRPAPEIDPQVLAERITAARSLLRTPLITTDSPNADDLKLIRRHRTELSRLFADGVGYRLHVDPTGARLFKAGLGPDPTRPLRRRSGSVFTPRAYALLCLTMAALVRSRSQLLVDELVGHVRSAAVDARIGIDLDSIADRRALHAALLALLDLGVLQERDGDLDHWADQRTPSLLDVRRDVLMLLVAAPLGAAHDPSELLSSASVPSAAGGARVPIRRRLLESPIMSTDDLTEEQAEWWRRNRNREREWFAEHFGLQVELRAEGALAVDPADELTDEEFPGRGGPRHLALLLLERLSDLARVAPAASPGERRTWRRISAQHVEETGRDLVGEWGEALRRDQRDDPGAAVREALSILEGMGLLRRCDDPGALEVHAAAARYAPRPVIAEAALTGERSLFDTTDPEEDG
jgi:uncharacterized protein (TIGR02678 family)